VSQSGWLDGSHLPQAAAWRRCVAATLALASGDFEATRPRRATSSIRFFEIATAQLAQRALPFVTFFPHARQMFSGRGAGVGSEGVLPLASRLLV
jgi:hypothetical protein